MRHTAVLALGLLIVSACSSSSSSSPPPPCNENPFECPTGQTCWTKDGSTFACVTSGPGKYGDSCQAVAGAAPCGDGLVCLQTTNAGGKCADFCSPTDQAHACSRGQCTAAAFGGPNGPITYVCAGGAPASADAGSD